MMEIGADSKRLLYFIVFIWVVHGMICVYIYNYIDYMHIVSEFI